MAAEEQRATLRAAVMRLLPSVTVVGLLTAVLTWRSWGRGQLLYRDFVSVPDPVIGPAALGTDGQSPRSVPLDAVMAVLDPVLPTDLQQPLMLAACVLLAGTGVAVLLRHRGQVSMLTGAVAAAWNPYVAERLLLGQPPTLLAYSMTPWMVAAVRSRLRPAPRVLAVALAVAPAALTPWGGVHAALVVLTSALLLTPRPVGRLLWAYAGLALLWCLPWAVPAARYGTGTGDADGAAAFAVAADSWLGTAGSAITLGGIWATAARPASREQVLPVLCSLLLLLIALWGAVTLGREGRRRELAALLLAWVVPTAGVLLLAWEPVLAAFGALQGVPGVGLWRDTHRLLALPAVAVAVLLGVGAGAVAQAVLRRVSVDRRPTVGYTSAVPAAVVVLVASLTLVTVPDLPAKVGDAYRPVSFPQEWKQVTGAIEAGTHGGATPAKVLSMPWQPFRKQDWAGPHPFLDPLSRAVDREVVASQVLTVLREGDLLPVGEDPPEAVHWAVGKLDPAALADLGIGFVVEWKTSPGELPADHAGLERVHQGEYFDVWAVPDRPRA